MQASKAAETPAGGSSDEAARLRAAGLSDDEIVKILVARGLGTTPASSGAAAGVPAAPVSGAMGNFSAIWTHARNIIPTMAAQMVMVFSTSAPPAARIAALLSVIVKAAFVLIFAYVVSLEFSQLRAATDRAHADACQSRLNFMASAEPSTPENQWPEDLRNRVRAQRSQWQKDCQ